jgi:hypothetical protein
MVVVVVVVVKMVEFRLVLYKPKLHGFIRDQQLTNFNGEQHHAWKLQCSVLSFMIIVLTKTALYDFY